ncbi:ATP-binding cassette, subfamily B [Granulicatella balaenopterae]|uniref:ATP-binding cassette, subfamily B n=1 Tax=Granulicatella balaenopterae TaxID=137733 RepID=A0A1H9IZH8_9LACT|nr:ABC transporter ATP-binding protein [Granulicatella balaenopterae]SEQ79928.1 ATP-binding cassette, subfamily B [Granulicatella balaenopterae]
MERLIREKLALTDQGAKDLTKASLLCFLSYLTTMAPVMLVMVLLEQLLHEASPKSSGFYIAMSVAILVLMYVVLSVEYDALYNATYKESENLRIEIARNLSELPLSYFSKHDLSDLAQTIMADVTAIEHALSHAIAKIIGFAGFFVVMAVMLLAGNIKLGLAVLVPVIAAIIVMVLSKKMQINNQTKYYHKLRENSELFQQTIELQQEIKSFGLTKAVTDHLYEEMNKSEKIHIDAEFKVAGLVTLAGLIVYLSLALVLVVGMKLYLAGEVSLLYFLGYLLAAFKIKDGVDGITMFIAELFYIDAMIQRIKEIKETKVQTGEVTDLTEFDVDLKHVSFGYDADSPVLKDISFTAHKNQVTALVGKSGCGKTSILRLVSRLYDYDSGSIKISDKDIKEIATESLFDKISIVFQDVTLFNASIMENIRIGKLSATDEEVMRVAQLAHCAEFIEKLPDGYDTIIGENGASLSGGERQRLSIARAFLKDAPIILLDEIAASLDVENEKAIQESLNTLTKGKTVIIISHRLKSIQNVDQIVVIDEGLVEASGTHEELLEKSPVYQQLITSAKLAEGFHY